MNQTPGNGQYINHVLLYMQIQRDRTDNNRPAYTEYMFPPPRLVPSLDICHRCDPCLLPNIPPCPSGRTYVCPYLLIQACVGRNAPLVHRYPSHRNLKLLRHRERRKKKKSQKRRPGYPVTRRLPAQLVLSLPQPHPSRRDAPFRYLLCVIRLPMSLPRGEGP